jgi:hypothetical protein
LGLFVFRSGNSQLYLQRFAQDPQCFDCNLITNFFSIIRYRVAVPKPIRGH